MSKNDIYQNEISWAVRWNWWIAQVMFFFFLAFSLMAIGQLFSNFCIYHSFLPGELAKNIVASLISYLCQNYWGRGLDCCIINKLLRWCHPIPISLLPVLHYSLFPILHFLLSFPLPILHIQLQIAKLGKEIYTNSLKEWGIPQGWGPSRPSRPPSPHFGTRIAP